jgi:hypothetical protein
MGIDFTGDWGKLDRIARNFRRGMARHVGRSLKKVERGVLSHLDNQDLEWDPLSKEHADRKAKEGLSPDTLRATNAMYQNITVHQEDALFGMVGVKRGVKTADGEDVTDIALIHEQPDDDGTVIPARKLWKPTFDALKDEIGGELKGAAIRIARGEK